MLVGKQRLISFLSLQAWSAVWSAGHRQDIYTPCPTHKSCHTAEWADTVNILAARKFCSSTLCPAPLSRSLSIYLSLSLWSNSQNINTHLYIIIIIILNGLYKHPNSRLFLLFPPLRPHTNLFLVVIILPFLSVLDPCKTDLPSFRETIRKVLLRNETGRVTFRLCVCCQVVFVELSGKQMAPSRSSALCILTLQRWCLAHGLSSCSSVFWCLYKHGGRVNCLHVLWCN